MAERRRDLRAVVRLEVEQAVGGLKRPPFYITGNISPSGMFLITTDPIPEKTRLKLLFQLPEDNEKIQVLGEVIWCRESKEKPNLPPGMGIKFLKIEEKDKDRIKNFVQGIIEQGKTAKMLNNCSTERKK